jgi:TolB protein
MRTLFRSGRKACAGAVLAALAVLGTAVHAAWATAPGKNGKIVFRGYFNKSHNRGALFTANPDRAGLRQITHPPKRRLDNEPDWSPDGRRIVFQRENRIGLGPPELYVVDADGSNLRQLTRGTTGCGKGGNCDSDAAWSPDGRQIAFTRESGPLVSVPGIGQRIERIGICVMNADGTNIRRLTQVDTPTRAEDFGPQWSPDGTRIVFQRKNTRALPQNGIAIYVVNADGTGERRVTPWALRAGDHPDWAPDGRRILFSSNFDPPPNVSANIYIIRPDGTGLKQLTYARGGKVQHLSSSFSPDGKWITFGRTPGIGKDGNADVFVMRVDGTQVRRVTRAAIWESASDWGPRG